MKSFLFSLICLLIILLQFPEASSVDTVEINSVELDYADRNPRISRQSSKPKINFLIKCSAQIRESQYLEVLPGRFSDFETLLADKSKQTERKYVDLPQLQRRMRIQRMKSQNLSFEHKQSEQSFKLLKTQRAEQLKTCKQILASGSLSNFLAKMKKHSNTKQNADWKTKQKSKQEKKQQKKQQKKQKKKQQKKQKKKQKKEWKRKPQSKLLPQRSKSLGDLLEEEKTPGTPLLQQFGTYARSYSVQTDVYQGFHLQIQEISSTRVIELKKNSEQYSIYQCMQQLCETTLPLPLPMSMVSKSRTKHVRNKIPTSPLLHSSKEKLNDFFSEEEEESPTYLKGKKRIPLPKKTQGMRKFSMPVLEVIVEMDDQYGQSQEVEDEVFDELAQLRREGSSTELFSTYVQFVPPKGPRSIQKTKDNFFQFDFVFDPFGYVRVGDQNTQTGVNPPLYQSEMDMEQHPKQKHSKGKKQSNSKHWKPDEQQNKNAKEKKNKGEKQKSSKGKNDHLSAETKRRIDKVRLSGGSLSQVPLYDPRNSKKSTANKEQQQPASQGQTARNVEIKSGHESRLLNLLAKMDQLKQQRMSSKSILTGQGGGLILESAKNAPQNLKEGLQMKKKSKGARYVDQRYRIKRGQRVSLHNLVLLPPTQFRNPIMSH